MKVCVLDETQKIELHSDAWGSHEWLQRIEKWQRNPSNDCLRARGDLRWIAACTAAQRIKACLHKQKEGKNDENH